MKKKKKPPREVTPMDAFHMGQAFMISTQSKDPSSQCGAILVGQNNLPIASGPNKIPSKFDESDIDWSKNDKYDFIDHAEEVAFHNARWFDLTEATMYVTALPCKRCMKAIVRHGLARVVYFPMPYKSGSLLDMDEKDKERIVEIARAGKVKLEEFKANLNWMRDQMAIFESWGIFT